MKIHNRRLKTVTVRNQLLLPFFRVGFWRPGLTECNPGQPLTIFLPLTLKYKGYKHAPQSQLWTVILRMFIEILKEKKNNADKIGDVVSERWNAMSAVYPQVGFLMVVPVWPGKVTHQSFESMLGLD